MFLRTAVALISTTAVVGFEYDESAAKADIWVNQALDCPVSQGADLSRWDCGLACDNVPLKKVHVLQNPFLDTYGIAAKNGHECLLAFRGSKSQINMMMNMDIMMQNPWGNDCDQCKVHGGFYKSWHSLRQQAVEALDAIGCSHRKLRVTGHSLGGSMAALAAYDMKLKGYAISAVYTYGQPRTGNSQWVHAFEKKLAHVPFFRVTDYKDNIPHLIMHNMFYQGWEHQSPEVYYDHTKLGAYTVCIKEKRGVSWTGWGGTCSEVWTNLATKDGGCYHCSYLGMNPCTCGRSEPECRTDSESFVNQTMV